LRRRNGDPFLISGGCFRDPNVRKQEYVKAGDDLLVARAVQRGKNLLQQAIQSISDGERALRIGKEL